MAHTHGGVLPQSHPPPDPAPPPHPPPQDLYFCDPDPGQRRACGSGWGIEAALSRLALRGGELLTDACLPYSPPDPRAPPPARGELCESAPACGAASPLLAQGSFDWWRLRSVAEAQRHIREWGAAISRFDIYEWAHG